MKTFLGSTAFLLALILTGSDGVWFPWLNLAGLLVMAILTLMANRHYPRRVR